MLKNARKFAIYEVLPSPLLVVCNLALGTILITFLLNRLYMKNVVKLAGLVLIFCAMSLPLPAAQTTTYSVLKVTGRVYCDRLKKDLTNGDKIFPEDKLHFATANGYLVLISPQDGRKVVKPNSKDTSSELKTLLTDIVSLEKRHTAVRGHNKGNKHQKALDTLSAQFNVETLLILGSGKVSFANTNVVLNDTARIKVGSGTGLNYSEKLVSTGHVVDLSKISLMGNLAPLKIQLVYYPNVNKHVIDSSPQRLGSFTPRYLDEEETLKKEVHVVITTFSRHKRHEVVQEIRKYIEDEYAAVLNENLIQWLKESNLLTP
jgi:hypothetical protein